MCVAYQNAKKKQPWQLPWLLTEDFMQRDTIVSSYNRIEDYHIRRKGGYNYDNRTLEGVSNRAVIPNMY